MIHGPRYNIMLGNKKTANTMRSRIRFVLFLVFLGFLSGCLNYGNPTPLNQAAWDNDVERIKALLDEGVAVDEVGTRPNGVRLATALDTAIVRGNVEATKFIIESGADVNLSRICCVNTPNGEYIFKGSALMLACLKGDLQIAEILLQAGANIDQLSVRNALVRFSGYDAYCFSAELGHIDIVELLIKHGIDINKKYKNGRKPAYQALDRGHRDYIIALVENGLKIESDIEWMQYNSEIAHIAADYYSESDEEKALQLYKQAVEFYPQGIKNYELIADGKKLDEFIKEFGKAALAVTATTLNKYEAKRQVTQNRQLYSYPGVSIGGGRIMYSYVGYNYTPNVRGDSARYYRLKAENSATNYNICKSILTCYEENNSDVTLADCVKATMEDYVD